MPDPVTHLSAGFIFARHFFKEHKILFLCSCMIPDIDGLVGIIYIYFALPSGPPESEIKRVFELFHPSLPASFLFLPFLVILVIYTFKLINKKLVPSNFIEAYVLVLTAILLHLGLDLLMTGNRPFWPLPFEAGLGIIPYSTWGVLIPMLTGLSLVSIDLIFTKFRQKKSS